MTAAALLLFGFAGLALAGAAPDLRAVKADLEVPPMTEGASAPGQRVKQVLAAYRNTAVHHALYLPTDWKAGRRYPVIVEWAGNGRYRNRYGDVSTGRVEGSKLGYGISGGKGFIWICMPYLNNAGTANVITWWGDKPDHRTGPTLDYCKRCVRFVCETYGGDRDAVILAGFSRGAIACNYLGLHDDEIAGLWLAFIPYSHYDGVHRWPYPGSDRASAAARLRRLKGRAQFICAEGDRLVPATKRFIESTGVRAPLTFLPTGFRNHNDAWALRPSPARAALRTWLQQVLRDRPGRPRPATRPAASRNPR